jgi:hypothetical protein
MVVGEVERLTGPESRWNGRVEIHDDPNVAGQPAFRAMKAWSCSVIVHRSVADDPGSLRSLVHEAVHSVSAGMTREAFDRFRGYEEGVAEWITRAIGPAVTRALQFDVSFEARDAFDDLIQLLEMLRDVTGLGAEAFYFGLLRTPLAERERTVVQWAMAANRAEKPARVLAGIAAMLRGLR